MKLVFLLGLFFCCCAVAEVRTWHNEAGKAVEAELLKVDGNLITLRLGDGRTAEVKLSEFCAEDGEFVKAWEVELPKRDWNIYGYDRSSGNELRVTFYDLKVKQNGKYSAVGEDLYEKKTPTSTSDGSASVLDDFAKIVKRFSSRSWEESDFDEYFKAPQVRYASAVMYPRSSSGAEYLFGVQEKVEPGFLVTHFSGTIRPKESGKYRFCGCGDDILIVKINGKVVLDGSLRKKFYSSWTSDDKNSGKYLLLVRAGGDNESVVYGDWLEMDSRNGYQMDILTGREQGGMNHFCGLQIEKEGADYKTVPFSEGGNKYDTAAPSTRKMLPLFCTAPISQEQKKAMDIKPDECVVEDPLFEVVVK